MKLLQNTVKTLLVAGAITLSIGCKKEGCTDELASNYTEDSKKDDGSCIFDTATVVAGFEYSIPTTYAFTNDAGESTVSFSGQQQRLAMLSEMVTYMKSANKAGTEIDAAVLKSMYANKDYTWTEADLNESTKNLKGKTAGDDAGVQDMFEGLMDNLAALSKDSKTKTDEKYDSAGVWVNGEKSYLQSKEGIEFGQLIEKGLMGAVFMNQLTVNYFGKVGDDATTVSEGKTYSNMQHHWDEAYGYFTSEVDYVAVKDGSGTNRFWGKYAYKREAVLQSGTKIALAFRTGRAAIDAGDFDARDLAITVIRDEMEKVAAGTAIHYIKGAIADAGKPTLLNHQLSEAKAFIYGLNFGYNSINGLSISSAEIDAVLALIGDDHGKIEIEKLKEAIDLLASKTGLTSVKESL
jgi:hypothetical protein